MRRTIPALLIVLTLAAAACSSGDSTPTATEAAPPDTASAPPSEEDPLPSETLAAEPAEAPTPTDSLTTEGLQPSIADRFDEIEPAFTITSGVEQIAVSGAEPGTSISFVTTAMVDERIEPGATAEPAPGGEVDAYGSLLVRNLSADQPWHALTADGYSPPVRPLSRDEHPDPAFYREQRLPSPGFGYITMRDGTTLAANIVLPGPAEDGPYPTVVEYSGYTPADPEGSGFKDLFIPLGYAYVGVNMRGTGCSGGSFRYFEYAQSVDGYDVIEAVAAQPWVFDNRVGMVGVSYPGISQLFVAQTQPPSLAAITPFSVIDDSYNSTLYPGGILNTGFAVEWTQDRVDNGKPAVDPDGNLIEQGGQGWAKDRISAGDETCEANQSLRLQNPDLVAEVLDTPFYASAIADEISPRLFVDQIDVPTFVAGAWQDEQTGGRFPTMLDRFTGTDHLYVTLMNGLHTESIGPANFPRWVEFLDLYVAKRTPSLGAARFVAPILAGGLFGTGELELPADRFMGMPHEEALAAFEAEPPIRVLFEEGAAEGYEPRTPLPRFEAEFDAWPIPEVEPTDWWLGVDGSLNQDGTDPLDAPEVSYLALPDGIPATFYEGNSSDIWRTDVQWNWQEPAAGTAATFVSPPLDTTTTMIGSGSADLWINSNLGDTDLEVTLSEVRPDGQEMYVQSGWLRASHRQLDESASTPLRPVHTHLQSDVAPLTEPSDDPESPTYDLARVEIFPFAHVFRAGSRIRISVDAPGGNRPVWIFDTISGGEQVTIGLNSAGPSKVVLPVVPGIEVPAEHPECGALRGQPCRTYAG